MTRWRAVGLGVLVALGIDTVVTILFFGSILLNTGVFVFVFNYASGLWTIVAGGAGGAVAGSLAASNVKNGCWHGLLVGAIGGLSIAIVTLLIGWLLFPPSGADDLRLAVDLIGIYWLLAAIPSTIAGGIGATVYDAGGSGGIAGIGR